MPRAFCSRVSAAGMKPEDKAVEPPGTASRSSTTQSMPASRRRMPAVMPQAPPPTITAGTWGVWAGMPAARTTRAGCWAMAGLWGESIEARPSVRAAADPATRGSSGEEVIGSVSMVGTRRGIVSNRQRRGL